MSAPASISRRIHFGSSPPIRPPEEPEGMAVGRIPRVTRLLALAIRFEELVNGGVVKNYAELARLGYISRARVTQIMNLLQLAPQIQEEVLFLPAQTGYSPQQSGGTDSSFQPNCLHLECIDIRRSRII